MTFIELLSGVGEREAESKIQNMRLRCDVRHSVREIFLIVMISTLKVGL